MATNVSAPLPDLSLEAQAILTVDALDAGAVITSMVIHFTQELPRELLAPALPPMFGYANGDAPTNGVA